MTKDHEPFGWVAADEVAKHFQSANCGTIYRHSGEGRVPLYTAPREWQGLTDEEIDDIWNRYCDEMGEASINDAQDIANAIEKALKERNT